MKNKEHCILHPHDYVQGKYEEDSYRKSVNECKVKQSWRNYIYCTKCGDVKKLD